MNIKQPRAARLALFALLLLIANAHAQTPAPQPKTDAPAAQPATIVGTWEGTYHGALAITLHVKRAGEKLTGTAIFYRIVDKGDGAKVAGQVEVELLEPKLAGSAMTFKVKPPAPPDAQVEPKAFDMELLLTGADEGVVITKRSGGADGADDEGGGMMRVKVTRKK
ncbi:MAG TPA: hypothetical protein VE775_11190 [Pyrinomonadaceae bacterium]|nr:hypothetical protein [Pyrinomonadaceae bacterium]